MCNTIFSVKARQIEDDKIELIWFYWPIEQKATCASFEIYYDNGSGQIDYENALVEIDYTGQRFYTWQSGQLAEKKYLFCIRALTLAGLNDGFPGQIKIHLDTTKPEAAEIVEVIAV